MQKRYEQQHQIASFAIGDLVSFHIPCIDRHGTDDRRLYCVVLRKPHPDRHVLLTHGLLNRHYPTRELPHVSDTLDTPNPQLLKKFNISKSETQWPDIAFQYTTLREDARPTAVSLHPEVCANPTTLLSPREQDFKCKGQCQTRRCSCVKCRLPLDNTPAHEEHFDTEVELAEDSGGSGARRILGLRGGTGGRGLGGRTGRG